MTGEMSAREIKFWVLGSVCISVFCLLMLMVQAEDMYARKDKLEAEIIRWLNITQEEFADRVVEIEKVGISTRAQAEINRAMLLGLDNLMSENYFIRKRKGMR